MVWMRVGNEDGPTTLEVAGMNPRCTSNFNYLGSTLTCTKKTRYHQTATNSEDRLPFDGYEAETCGGIRDSSIRIRDLSIIAMRVNDNRSLAATQNTAGRMIMSLQSIRTRIVKELIQELKLSNLATKPLQRRINFWRKFETQTSTSLFVTLLDSNLARKHKTSNTRNWMGQLKKDTETVWGEAAMA